MERHREKQRVRSDAPTQYETEKATRQEWERANPHKVSMNQGPSTIDSGRWAHHSNFNAAAMLDPTRDNPSPEEAEMLLQAMMSDEEFMSNYENGDPISKEAVEKLERIAYGGGGR